MTARRSVLRARAGALALAAVVAAGASGCSVPSIQRVGLGMGLSRVGMGAGSYKTTWTVGSCHRLDQLTETDPVYNSDTSPAVPCTGPHESETFAVVPITGAVARPASRPSPEWLQSALAGACSPQMLAGFLGEQNVDAPDDVSVLQIVPSVPEWRAGVRKVRCDVLVGPRTTESVASVTRSLAGILTTTAGARFRTCRLGGIDLPCDGLHTEELVNPPVAFTDAELAKGQAYAIAKVAKACDAEIAAYVGAPLAERPDLKLFPEQPGDPQNSAGQAGRCWVGPADGLSITGSVRRTGTGKVS